MKENQSIFENEFKTAVNDHLVKHNLPKKLSELDNIPFNSFEELKSALNNKQFSISAHLIADEFEKYISGTEKLIDYALKTIPIGIFVTNLIFAFITKHWLLLLACITTLLGFLSSSPYRRLRNFYLILSLLLCLVFLKFNLIWGIILGSYFFSLLFAVIIRLFNRRILIKRALLSEQTLVYLILRKIIILRDNKTLIIYNDDALNRLHLFRRTHHFN